MAHPRDHQATVDAWLDRVAVGAPASSIVASLQSALDVLWRRAQQTLGDVTVRAIVSRVVMTASARSPLLRELEVQAEGVSCARLARVVAPAARELPSTVDQAALRAAARDLLTELLTVLGDLTANVLTAPLHDVLLGLPAVDGARPGVAASLGEVASLGDVTEGGARTSGHTWDGGAVEHPRDDGTGEAT